ncbi:KAP family P-loop NTPase fold protein [Mesoflavibacter zeaxanthinifaciens]|uniref:KAP family P-loop NTPase fold protein n=1 Tax=Mesoflavibacter zeaxanthinifaciens TaxID=393060 RepID=UPI00042551BC|nr:P-loop NTPase fold protein [Mesoflavibacter zeaxanthinifaciens]
MSKLLPNLPIEDLTPENDYLRIIDKGEIIKTFLQSNKEQFSKIKMFSLYGEWGSGKSTLMKYLEKELKDDFNTFFFEAWQYESDDNLSLSLLEYLSYETSDSTDEALGEIVEVAAKLFKGFSKSLKISIPGLSIDGSKLVETLEEEPKETFYQLKKKFNEEFVKWEEQITSGDKPKFNIVFIDDLDRCEPENVLNLLSALKLFFTYGVKTIFFCGVDKKAVREAVKTKYREVVKADEYLEKIIDISFTMPEHNNLLKLVSHYFDNIEIKKFNKNLIDLISEFLSALKFTNPRRVKKLLNKYSILKVMKEDNNLKINMPNIITFKEGNYFETVLSIYFIILHEFYPQRFEDLLDLKKKEINYYKAIYGGNIEMQKVNISSLLKKGYSDLGFGSYLGFDRDQLFSMLSVHFLPNDVDSLKANYFRLDSYQSIKVSEKNIEFRFVDYIAKNFNEILNHQDTYSDLSVNELKLNIKDIL